MHRDSLLLLLIASVVAVMLFTPGRRDLFVGDETKYGQILYEMRRSDSLLVPTLEGRPYSHKPPLHFWIVYLLTFVFGEMSTWAFVLPSLVAFVVMLWLIRKVARELFGGSGLFASFIFSTFWLAWGLAQTARMDMEFLVYTTGAVLFVHRFLTQKRSRDLILAGLFVGVAILVKGPMAFVIVLTLFIVESIRRRVARRGDGETGRPGEGEAIAPSPRRPVSPSSRTTVAGSAVETQIAPSPRLPVTPSSQRALAYIAAIVLAIGIPLAWLIPALMAGGPDYAREIVVEQNAGRAINAWVHREPFYFYIAHFPVTFLPWFLLAIITIIAVYRTPQTETLTPELETPVEVDRGTRHPALGTNQAERFCVSWFLAVLVPFSLISGKLDVYMLPAFVPIALLCGAFVEREGAGKWTRAAIRGNLALIVFFLLFGIAGPIVTPRLPDFAPEVAILRKPIVNAWFYSTAVVALIALIVAFRGKDRLFRSTVAVGIAAFYPLAYLMTALLPFVNDSASTQPLVRALRKQTEDGRQIGLWRAPHLWTPDMPPSYRQVEYIGSDKLRKPGPKPLIIATRADRAHHLGEELLANYQRVDRFRMRGKEFDVYRRK